MSEQVTVTAFPANYCEALALAYIQGQDLSSKTPEEVAQMYWDAYNRISKVKA